MELKDAMEMADKFPELVDNHFKKSAEKATSDIRWFIDTIYRKGYEIRKKEVRKNDKAKP